MKAGENLSNYNVADESEGMDTGKSLSFEGTYPYPGLPALREFLQKH